MSVPAALVCLVDDDPDVRDSLSLLLDSVGMDVAAYASAEEFLAALPRLGGRPCCLLLDVRMEGMSGLDLLDHLRRERVALPTIVITGHGDIPMAVRAMKLGASDFISKPFDHEELVALVRETARGPHAAALPESTLSDEELGERWRSLTEREQQIFWAVVSGDANKLIAFSLGISVRTVEAHRARIMRKMGVRKLADLVLLSVRLQGTVRVNA